MKRRTPLNRIAAGAIIALGFAACACASAIVFVNSYETEFAVLAVLFTFMAIAGFGMLCEATGLADRIARIFE